MTDETCCGACGYPVHATKEMACNWCRQSADRIEALTAELATCEKYRDAYAEMGRIGTQAVRDLETKLAAAEAEAKKYKHAFAAQSRKLQAVLHIEGVKATLAEIKGGNDAESNL